MLRTDLFSVLSVKEPHVAAMLTVQLKDSTCIIHRLRHVYICSNTWNSRGMLQDPRAEGLHGLSPLPTTSSLPLSFSFPDLEPTARHAPAGISRERSGGAVRSWVWAPVNVDSCSCRAPASCHQSFVMCSEISHHQVPSQRIRE